MVEVAMATVVAVVMAEVWGLQSKVYLNPDFYSIQKISGALNPKNLDSRKAHWTLDRAVMRSQAYFLTWLSLWKSGAGGYGGGGGRGGGGGGGSREGDWMCPKYVV